MKTNGHGCWRALATFAAIGCLIAAPGTPAVADPAPDTPDTPGSALGRAPTTPGKPGTVTLITGDRVTVLPDGSATVAEPDRRPGMTYQISRQGDHTSVIPGDAVALLASGQLDERLFDVTVLLESGYGDAQRHDLGLIISGSPTSTTGTSARGAMAAETAFATSIAHVAGADVTRTYPDLGMVAARVPAGATSGVWNELTRSTARTLRAGTRTKIWLDERLQPSLDVSVPRIGAPAAWQAGYTGQGITVAVLDTGVDASHPDLAGKVVEEVNFTDEDSRDLVGHGTHVAATIAGSGEASGGKYRGVAPDAQLLDGKICIREGCPTSAILAGMEWAAANRRVRIVNMSIGGADTPDLDPMEQAINTLTVQYGTLFVVAAGNDGIDQSVNSPASADAALAVGAVDKAGNLAGTSSRGPRVGDGAIKPDVTAPGVDITAARGKDATKVPGGPGDAYTTVSGTSMATPHVAGAAALLAQAQPEATPERLKNTLMATADPDPSLGVFAQGAGRVNVGRAVSVKATLLADPVQVSLGLQRWPHNDDTPVSRTITYRNETPDPVTLALSHTANGPDGAPAPAGIFTLTPASVTVPAGGSAEATITANTALDVPDGIYSGRVTATGTTATLTTPFVVIKEVESYDVTITSIGLDGAPSDRLATTLVNLDRPEVLKPPVRETTRLRLPKGRYCATMSYLAPLPDGRQVLSILADPVVTVTEPVSLTWDLRDAKPVSITPPPAAEPTTSNALFTYRVMAPARWGLTVLGASPEALFLGQRGDHSTPEFLATFDGVWLAKPASQPAGDPAADPAPSRFNLAWGSSGRMFDGLVKKPGPAELATVVSDYSPITPASTAYSYSTPMWQTPGGYYAPSSSLYQIAVPSRTAEVYNTDGQVLWQRSLAQMYRSWSVYGPPSTYQGGKTSYEKWNRGVFGPSTRTGFSGRAAATRTGDVITAAISMLGDGDGRFGWDADLTTATTLSRDGKELGTGTREPGTGTFTVPADPGRYRLSSHLTRGDPAAPAATVSADWTFRSSHRDSGTTNLPLWSANVVIESGNTLPAGKTVTLPVTVAAQPGSRTGKLCKVTVEVSFDDGKTWQPVRLAPGPASARQSSEQSARTFRATITNPAGATGATGAALRTRVWDSAGNTLDQTITNAYHVVAS